MTTYHMPPEWAPHTQTIMAWPGAHATDYWPPGNHAHLLADVRRVALAIARFEPVTIYAARSQAEQARSELGSAGERLDIELRFVDDDDIKPWMRDIAPTFVRGRHDARARGIDFHFNGWGGKDGSVSNRVLARRILRDLGVEEEEVETGLVAEGGALETDGEGTLLATRSSLVNANRNPGMSAEDVEGELGRLLGLRKVVWLGGVRGADTTDCHVDALARFAGPGVVLLSRPSVTRAEVWMAVYEDARKVLETEVDARGRGLRVVDVPEPDISGIPGAEAEMIPSYVNYFLASGAVVAPQFGVEDADAKALEVLGSVFPGREVVPVHLHGLPNAGGGLHCITQQVV